jgi:predicted DNA-binding transcriptional regulator AlpA
LRVPKAQRVGDPYPPRAMRAEQAATYLGMSRASFLRLVEDGTMPPPIKVRSMTLWDRHDLDDAFEELKRGGGKPTENTVLKRLRELKDERRREGSHKVLVPEDR